MTFCFASIRDTVEWPRMFKPVPFGVRNRSHRLIRVVPDLGFGLAKLFSGKVVSAANKTTLYGTQAAVNTREASNAVGVAGTGYY